jgi:hypothetical protein
LAAMAAIANQHRLPPPPFVLPTIDDPDVNVVDMDDGIEGEDSNRQSTNETTSSADHRYAFCLIG